MAVRVAITGLGAISSLGHDVASHLEAIQTNRTGIRPAGVPTPERSGSPCAEVQDFQPEAQFEPRQLAMMDRASQLAVFAARQAVGDAGDVLDRASPMRSGVLFSAALGYSTIEEGYPRAVNQNWLTGGSQFARPIRE